MRELTKTDLEQCIITFEFIRKLLEREYRLNNSIRIDYNICPLLNRSEIGLILGADNFLYTYCNKMIQKYCPVYVYEYKYNSVNGLRISGLLSKIFELNNCITSIHKWARFREYAHFYPLNLRGTKSRIFITKLIIEDLKQQLINL